MLLHGGHRQHAPVRVLQLQARFLRLHGARLDEKDAGDDLQAVGDAMLHLLQQQVFFLHQLLHLPFHLAPASDVLERQQNGGVRSRLVEHLARIQQHVAPSDRRKDAVDLIALDRRTIRRDLFQHGLQLRQIPLAAVDFPEQAPDHVLTHEPEGLIEGAAGGDDAQILVEHQERVANGIDDGMRERDAILPVVERGVFRQIRSQHVTLSPCFRAKARPREFS